MSESSKWIEIITAIGVILTALFTGLYWWLFKKRGEPTFSLIIDQVKDSRLEGRIIIDNPGPNTFRIIGFKAGKPKGLLIALPHTGSIYDPVKGSFIGPVQVKETEINYPLNIPPRGSESVSLIMDLPSSTRRASLVSVFAVSMASSRFLPVRQIKKAAIAKLTAPIANKADL